jgi:uncharacterized damage-inducible protein DinB
MKRTRWVDKKFYFNLSPDQYDSILNELNETPKEIARLVSALPKEILIRKVDDKWSIQENIGHLIDLEKLNDKRIDEFIRGKEVLSAADMNNKKTEGANHNSREINDLVNQLKELRKRFVKRLRKLDGSVSERTSIHPRLNQPMKPIDMVYFVLEHDKHHIETIKELIERFSTET